MPTVNNCRYFEIPALSFSNSRHWEKLMRALLKIPAFFNRRHTPYDHRHISKFQKKINHRHCKLFVDIYVYAHIF